MLPLAPLVSIPAERGLCVRKDGLTIALFRIDETVHAIDDSCPHHGASLSSGRLQGCIVACPAHGLKFDVRSGHGTTNPPLLGKRYPVHIVDGMVMLDRSAG